MHSHLAFVQAPWKSNAHGVWPSIDFSKAFDSTGHELMGIFLTEIGIPVPWVSSLEQFLQGNLRFLVSNELRAGTGVGNQTRGHPIPHALFPAHNHFDVETQRNVPAGADFSLCG